VNGGGTVKGGTAPGWQRVKSVCVAVLKCKEALNLRRMSLKKQKRSVKTEC
jgi:hypothetical protein